MPAFVDLDADLDAVVSNTQVHTVRWEPDRLPSGVYFCRLRAGDFRATRLLSFVR